MLLTTIMGPVDLFSQGYYICQAHPQIPVIRIMGNVILRFYWDSFFGGFTITASIFLLYTIVKYGTNQNSNHKLNICFRYALIGGLLSLFSHLLVDFKGQASNIMAPLVVIVYVFYCHRIGWLRKYAVAILCFLIFLEYTFSQAIAYSLTAAMPREGTGYLFDRLIGVSPNLITWCLVASICLLLVYCYAIISLIGSRNTPKASVG